MKKVLSILLALVLLFAIVTPLFAEGVTLEDLDKRVKKLEQFSFMGFLLSDFTLTEQDFTNSFNMWRLYFTYSGGDYGLRVELQTYDLSAIAFNQQYGWLKLGDLTFYFGKKRFYYAYSATGVSCYNTGSNTIFGYGYTTKTGLVLSAPLGPASLQFFVPTGTFDTLKDGFVLNVGYATKTLGVKFTQFGTTDTALSVKLGLGSISLYPGLWLSYPQGGTFSYKFNLVAKMAFGGVGLGLEFYYDSAQTLIAELGVDYSAGSLELVPGFVMTYDLANSTMSASLYLGGLYYIGYGDIQFELGLDLTPNFAWNFVVEFFTIVL